MSWDFFFNIKKLPFGKGIQPVSGNIELEVVNNEEVFHIG